MLLFNVTFFNNSNIYLIMNDIDLKKERERRGWTQQDLADRVKISRKTINTYENQGYIPDSRIDTFRYIFEKNNVTSEKKREVNDNDIEYNVVENTNGNKFIKMPDGSLMIKVPLIPFNAYASFLEVYEDEYQVHQEFESTYFTVDKVGRGRYVAFTVKNDSMNGGSLDDTPSGAQVLARELGRQHWKDGFKTTKYGWIIICTTGIFHKDIVDLNSNNGEITCSSRNPSPEFPNFKINLNGVHSIYKVIKRTF